MDDQVLKRVLFECIKDRSKEQTICGKSINARNGRSYYKYINITVKASVLSYEPLYTSSHVLKYDYPWSRLTVKTPRPLSYLLSVIRLTINE